MEINDKKNTRLGKIDRVLRLDRTVFKDIQREENGLKNALSIVMYSTIIGIGILWVMIFRLEIFLLIFIVLIGSPIIWFVESGVLHLTARLLGGKSNFRDYLIVLGYIRSLGALNIIPGIGGLIGSLWRIPCIVVATEEVHKLSTGRSILTIVIPLIAAILLAILIVVFIVVLSALFGWQNPLNSLN